MYLFTCCLDSLVASYIDSKRTRRQQMEAEAKPHKNHKQSIKIELIYHHVEK
jgi:hypothetical protein